MITYQDDGFTFITVSNENDVEAIFVGHYDANSNVEGFYGIPSMLDLGTGYYYNKPWERSADIFGGVSRQKHNISSSIQSLVYLIGILLI